MLPMNGEIKREMATKMINSGGPSHKPAKPKEEMRFVPITAMSSASSSKSSNITLNTYNNNNNNNNAAIKSKLMPINVVPPLTMKANPAAATVAIVPAPPLIQFVSTGGGSAGNVSNSNLLAILTPSGKKAIISAPAKGNAQSMLIRSSAAVAQSQLQQQQQLQLNGNPGQTKTTSTVTTVSAPANALIAGSVPVKASTNALVPNGQISLLANSRAPVILSKAAVDKLKMKFNQAKANPNAILLSNNKNQNNNNNTNNNNNPSKILPTAVKNMSKPDLKPDPKPDTVPAPVAEPVPIAVSAAIPVAAPVIISAAVPVPAVVETAPAALAPVALTPTAPASAELAPDALASAGPAPATVVPVPSVPASVVTAPTVPATTAQASIPAAPPAPIVPAPVSAIASPPTGNLLPNLTIMKVQKPTVVPPLVHKDLPALNPTVELTTRKGPSKLQRSKSLVNTEPASPGSERRHSVAIMAKEVDVIEQPRTIETITIDDDDSDQEQEVIREKEKQAKKPQKTKINKPTVTTTTTTTTSAGATTTTIKTPTCTPTPTPISSRKNSTASASTLSSISSSDVEEISVPIETKVKKEEPSISSSIPMPNISILKAETLNLSNEDFERSLRCDEQVSPSSSSSSSLSIKSIQKNSERKTISPTPAGKRPANASERPNLVLTNLRRSMLNNLSMIRWRGQQPGQLPNSMLRFELNNLNLLQLNERCEPRQGPANYFERSLFDRPDRRPIATVDPLLYLCQRCNCHGPAADFLAPRYCSLSCVRRGQKRRLPPVSNTQSETKMSRLSAAASAAAAAAASMVSEQVVKAASVQTSEPKKVSTTREKTKFRWSEYLSKKGEDIAAPIHLFSNPFPINPNGFQRGMKVEAIDPENCSLFCVCTIVEVRGYRLKLHFDGYASMYDFYVNADSMDIFPPGWCYSTGRILQAPKGYCPDRFSWARYLVKIEGKPAPRHLFSHLNMSPQPSMANGFSVGMHLEAEDLNDTGKICVATVADILDERIRVHFDGWDDCYDFWVHINSPYIHPCGWHEGRQQLIVPPDYQNVAFSWPEYIKESGGIGAPAHLFKPRLPMEFQSRMKLEVVDQRNPCLIRPATVINRKGYRVQLHLDCWPTEYFFWLEDDSPDLHPIGWCEATSHELETPPGFLQKKSQMPCDVEGCRGFGNAKRFNLNVHALRDCCPYAPENWRQWRSKTVKPARVSPEHIKRGPPKKLKQVTPSPPSTIKIEPKAIVAKKMTGKADKPLDSRSFAIAKAIVNEYGPQFQRNYRLWQKNTDFDLDKIKSNPLYWTNWDVYEYVERALNCKVIAKAMFEEDIDGRALLMLGRNDLSKHLKLKIGPAVKLFSLIVNLRIAVVCKFETSSTGLTHMNLIESKMVIPKQELNEQFESTQEYGFKSEDSESEANATDNDCDQEDDAEAEANSNDDDDEVVLDNEDFLSVQPSSSRNRSLANNDAINHHHNNDSGDVLMAPLKLRMPMATASS